MDNVTELSPPSDFNFACNDDSVVLVKNGENMILTPDEAHKLFEGLIIWTQPYRPVS